MVSDVRAMERSDAELTRRPHKDRAWISPPVSHDPSIFPELPRTTPTPQVIIPFTTRATKSNNSDSVNDRMIMEELKTLRTLEEAKTLESTSTREIELVDTYKKIQLANTYRKILCLQHANRSFHLRHMQAY